VKRKTKKNSQETKQPLEPELPLTDVGAI
jgi:hypothetical protein